MIIPQEDYLLVTINFYHPLHFLWSEAEYLATFTQYSTYNNYEGKKKLFLELLERLLSDNRLKIGKSGMILQNTTEEIIELFTQSIPESVEDLENGLWFLGFNENDCPGGAVWIINRNLEGNNTTPVGDGTFYYWT